MAITSIEITFPVGVELNDKEAQELVEIAGRICDQWKETHPDRTMWPAGIGFRPTFIPMTREQESDRGMEFDESTFQIECFERADYSAKCAKCGFEQGDHAEHITNPPAGDCEFEMRNS